MFVIQSTVTPTKERFDRALGLLPQAHSEAARGATEHLHQVTAEAAQRAGHDPDVVALVEHPLAPSVGLSRSAEGDKVADVEYGHFRWDKTRRRQVYERPSPTLRQALRSELPTARQLYWEHLRRGIGI